MLQITPPHLQGEKYPVNKNEHLRVVLDKINSIKPKYVKIPEEISYKGVSMEVMDIDYNFENVCHENDLSFFLENGHLTEGSYRRYQDHTIALPTTPKTIHCEYVDDNKTIRHYTMSYDRYLKHGKAVIKGPQLLHED